MVLPRRSSEWRTETFKCSVQAHNVYRKIQTFFQDHKLCDIALISALDGTRVETHRAVLAASSDYFLAMFCGSLTESRAKEVILDQIDGLTLQLLVNFMYTSEVEITPNNVENLLTTASLFQMDSVVEECCSFMIKQLDPANCLGMTLYAEQHNHRRLHAHAYNMVCDFFTELQNEDEFYMLDAGQLCKFLESDDLCVYSESDVFHTLMAWVNHDKPDRLEFLPELLTHLRFPFLKRKFILKEIEPVCPVDECQKQITLLSLGLRRPLHMKPRNTKQKIFHISVWFTSDSTLRAEAYSPILNQWTYLEWRGRPTNRSVFSVVVLDHKLIIAGGRTKNFTATNIVESMCTKTLEWTKLAPMLTARHSFKMAEMDGKIYAVGGRNGISILRSVERYDPVTNKWEYIAPMPEKHIEHTVLAHNGYLYVVGGSSGFSCYNPDCNAWSRRSMLLPGPSKWSMAVVNNKIYAGSVKGNMLQRYVPYCDYWEKISPLGLTSDYIKCCALREYLFVNCGNFCMKQYNTKTDEWTTLAPLTRFRGKGILITI